MRWKLSLHSISYSGSWPGQTRLSVPAFLKKASSLGFDSVMLMAKRPHLSPVDYSPSQRQRLREQVDSLGLTVDCLAAYTNFCISDQSLKIPHRELQLMYLTDLAKFASELGTPLIRVFTGQPDPEKGYQENWDYCVSTLREASQRVADYGVTLGVQNYHDLAMKAHSLRQLLRDVDQPNCRAMFDAWAPTMQGDDLVESVRTIAPYVVHTTVADYDRRPHLSYVPTVPPLVDKVREEQILAVPVGQGIVDYRAFLKTLAKTGYQGTVAYEMCTSLVGGGSESNLDQCARHFIEYMAQF
ncbi:sugar phosphate isomerase/epimerase family protein [Planctomicrobium sp. SH661]|uniref:sugar phosphate isomerase/epimerase family protein n=1 Tax=Planctomicrobium sp. SH661 TaxID=3448124 RepID=UPI003F5B8924